MASCGGNYIARPLAPEWPLCAYVCEYGTMVGVGQALGPIVCGLVGPGTSHCAHNGAE